MAHSFRSHYFHLIWSTKDRAQLITTEVQSSLYAYIGGIIRNHKGKLLEAGGTLDHVHLLIGLDVPDRFSDIIRDIKSNSSSWLKKNLGHQNFGWQEGYGSFSVSYSSLEKVKHYIKNQEENHKTITFDEEYLQILRKHQIEFDSRFVLG